MRVAIATLGYICMRWFRIHFWFSVLVQGGALVRQKKVLA
jgi:hypothetical protein